MNNVFKNAYFGKSYRTRDGRKAIYIRQFIYNGYKHLVTTGNIEFAVDESGNVIDNTLKKIFVLLSFPNITKKLMKKNLTK